MEPFSPELVLVAPPDERKRMLMSLPERDPYEFLRMAPLQTLLPEARVQSEQLLAVKIAAYVLVDLAAVVVFGVVLIALLVAALTALDGLSQ